MYPRLIYKAWELIIDISLVSMSIQYITCIYHSRELFLLENLIDTEYCLVPSYTDKAVGQGLEGTSHIEETLYTKRRKEQEQYTVRETFRTSSPRFQNIKINPFLIIVGLSNSA